MISLCLQKSFIDYNVKQSKHSGSEGRPWVLWSFEILLLERECPWIKKCNRKSSIVEWKTLSIDSLPREVLSAYKYKSLKNKISAHVVETKQNKDLLKTGEEIIIEYVLNQENWNLTNTAKRLGISRPTLYRKIDGSPKLSKRKKMLQQEVS